MADEETPEETPETEAEAATAEDAAVEADAPETSEEEASEPAEAAAPLSKKEQRKADAHAEASKRPQRSAEERDAERRERRAKKAVARRRRREQEKAKKAASGEKKEGTPPAEPVATNPQVRLGTVVSAKPDKTITVRIDVARRHRKYEKIVRSSTTLHAHDETNDANEGDRVRVVECRPLSRTKRWKLEEVLERAK